MVGEFRTTRYVLGAGFLVVGLAVVREADVTAQGPMLAIAAAASDLRLTQTLDVDLVMIVEGEEETGSAGFQDAIRKNRVGAFFVGFLFSESLPSRNHTGSHWRYRRDPGFELVLDRRGHPVLDFWPARCHPRHDQGAPPSLLSKFRRAVVDPFPSLQINSDQPDLHSGMQGGVVSEPLVDMVRLLASLTDADGRVRIPGFLDDVRRCVSSLFGSRHVPSLTGLPLFHRLGTEESALYDAVIERCSR